ncbi:phytanoyl-CoA dioxygenase family protein [Nonomuraea sp. NPDC004297]
MDVEQHHHDLISNGFTVIRGVYGQDDVASMYEANERIVSKVRAEPERYIGTRYTSRVQGNVDTWGVNNIFSPELYEPALAAAFDNPRFMALPHRVLGSRLRFWSAHTLWSPTRVDYELNWHKDNHETDHYDPAGRPLHVQFNVCLTDDSSFRALPGSHRRPATSQERKVIESFGTGSMPGEVVVHCLPGDVIYMNYHMIHRGSCSATTHRRTLHMNVQAQDEPTGGQTSYGYMRDPEFLAKVEPTLQTLMRNAIEWDDTHPISRAEARRRLRVRQKVRSHTADGKTGGS